MGGSFANWEFEVHQLLKTRDIQVDPDAIASIAQSSFESGDSPVSFVVKHRQLLQRLSLPGQVTTVTQQTSSDRIRRYSTAGWMIGMGIALGPLTIMGFGLAAYGCYLEILLKKELEQEGLSYEDWTRGKRQLQALRILGPIIGILGVGLVAFLVIARR